LVHHLIAAFGVVIGTAGPVFGCPVWIDIYTITITVATAGAA
jgi:hypothetical protein